MRWDVSQVYGLITEFPADGQCIAAFNTEQAKQNGIRNQSTLGGDLFYVNRLS